MSAALQPTAAPNGSQPPDPDGPLTRQRKRVVRVLHRRPLLSLAALFLVGVGLLLLSVNKLANHLNEQNALRYAAQLSDTLFKTGQVYSQEVIARVKPLGVRVTHKHLLHKNAIPVPATFSILLAKKISEGTGPNSLRTNLYSEYPFEGGNNIQAMDRFQRRSLAELGTGKKTFYSFEDFDSRPSLRYANALVMKQTCLGCHNTDANSPKRDWKIGDLRGAREVIIPMGSSLPIIRDGLIEILGVMLAITCLLLAVLSMVLNALRDTNTALARFVPTAFLRHLGKEEITEVRLGDSVEREMTVLFSDIRSFTSLSERMTPAQTFAFINDYLKVVGPVVRDHGGFIDKYIGDAVMALFEDPQDAVQAAVAMLHALATYNEQRQRTGRAAVQVGVGLNTGLVRLGTIGESDRMEGTVISDTVNVAARVEDLTKRYGAAVVVTASTYAALRCPQGDECRFLDHAKVKGKHEPVSVYEVLVAYPAQIRAARQAALPAYREALQAFQEARFSDAEALFAALVERRPDDRLYGIYLKRSRAAASGA